jgi:hypothetical protein
MTSNKKPDIRQDLLTREQFDRNYSDWAFYALPDQFLFHHYDEEKVLICSRLEIASRVCIVAGIEKYVVEGKTGDFYGIYDTRDITWYIKSGTWVIVEEPNFLVNLEIAQLERKLVEKRKELI